MQKGFFVGAFALLLLAAAAIAGIGSFAGAGFDAHLPGVLDQVILAAVPVAAAKVEVALYTIPQVCERLCIGRSTAYALIGRGDLEAVKLKGLDITRVTAKSVDRLLGAATKAHIADSYGTVKATRRRLARSRAGESVSSA